MIVAHSSYDIGRRTPMATVEGAEQSFGNFQKRNCFVAEQRWPICLIRANECSWRDVGRWNVSIDQSRQDIQQQALTAALVGGRDPQNGRESRQRFTT